MNKRLMTFLQGSIMGIVETIPGVSGSTMALIMGIYSKFIDFLHDVSNVAKEISKLFLGKSSVAKVIKQIKDINYVFGVPLVLGMLVGIGVFSHVMSFMLENFTSYTYAFFFGLVLASVSVPWNQIKKRTQHEYIVLLLSTIIFFVFLGLNPPNLAEAPSKLVIFVAGYFGISAMLLPGVSGSFVMLIFGVYDYVISAVKNLTSLAITNEEFMNLAVLGLGMGIGFATFVRVIKYFLERYPSYLMAFLVGLMLASLRVLWPFLVPDQTGHLIRAVPWALPTVEMFLVFAIFGVTFYVTRILSSRISSN